MNHFWNYDEPAEGQPCTLRLDGPIAIEGWFDDEVTPAQFRAELAAHPGDLTVFINSPGGDVVAGSLIYSMLREHPGRITVRVDGIAASAASVVAMAGDTVEMAPTAYMMIHNATTIAMGDNRDMRKAAEQLDEINRGIRTAYALKTGKSERELARLMDAETWMSAQTALAEGFCDAIAYAPPAANAADLAQADQPAAPATPAENQSITATGAASIMYGWADKGAQPLQTISHTHAIAYPTPLHTHATSALETLAAAANTRIVQGTSNHDAARQQRREQHIQTQQAADQAKRQARAMLKLLSM